MISMLPAARSLTVAVVCLLLLASLVDDVRAAGSAAPAALMRRALIDAKAKSSEVAVIEQEPEEKEKEPWTRYAFLRRIQESGVNGLTIAMPETFTRFLTGVWRSQVWQVHEGRFGKWVMSEEAQYSNVICSRMKVRNVTLQSQGVFGETTQVSVDMISQCTGAYCWQKMGWVSRGDFQTLSDGKLDILFPPILPSIGDNGPYTWRLDTLGENNGWCSPDLDNWLFEVDFMGKGLAGHYEDLLSRPFTQNTFAAAICRSIRRKISLDEDDLKFFESPPFKCGRAWLPQMMAVMVILLNIAVWICIYNRQVAQLEIWKKDYIKSEHAYHAHHGKRGGGKAKSKAKAKPKGRQVRQVS